MVDAVASVVGGAVVETTASGSSSPPDRFTATRAPNTDKTAKIATIASHREPRAGETWLGRGSGLIRE